MISIETLPDQVGRFVAAQSMGGNGPGNYRYARAATRPTLYSSCYAAMTRSLLGSLAGLEAGERDAWAAYLNAHQDDDGLYRDPVIFDQGWYSGDPLWCGRPHLSCHVITALTCLNAAAVRPFSWLSPWLDADTLVRWLEERDWSERVGWSGNEILNLGTLLQYARDFHEDSRAARAVDTLLEWLSAHHLNPETGVWGQVDVSDPIWRSHAVQAAYHLWLLFSYAGVAIPYLERAIDTILATQNPWGGFGWGVHNSSEPFMSSACEDIDSIDPLCRMAQVSTYRWGDIRAALYRAADWVTTNQMPDGGFVFMRGEPFEYGHRELSGERNAGAMFPTWFRLLSLALIGKALPDHPLASFRWNLIRCPGMQFWELL